MAEVNGESLEICYTHLHEANALLAYYLANAPTEILKIFDEAALAVVLTIFPDYKKIRSEIHVRITDLPTSDSLRDLRCVLQASAR